MNQWVYSFGNSAAQGDGSMKDLLGGKGANLAEMSKIGLPVPPGFTIPTNVCTYYYGNNKTYPGDLNEQVEKGLALIEERIGKKLGDEHNPLLVSVRSGARSSMPGMMDTILNLGLNDKTAQGMITMTGNERFVYDSYRRFICMFSTVVLGVNYTKFEEILEYKKHAKGVHLDTELDSTDLQDIVEKFKAVVNNETGQPFPQDVNEQLWGAIGAVLKSWMSDRAIHYRKMYDISEALGTAINVQSMVFGNMGQNSATGVAFTRDPSTGEKYLYGEYLINAQGEDVVAGIRTPQQITVEGKNKQRSNLPAMEETLPSIYTQLVTIYHTLENHYRDMQDIEFTVQEGVLWMLQTRNAKRTTKAAVKVAVDMVREGLITKEEALLRITPEDLDQLLHPTLDPNAKIDVIAVGLPASPGAAVGTVVFYANDAEERANRGESVILVRTETSPEDIHGMSAAKGILTSRGGMTSHAAVVARGMGRPCVSGAGTVSINYKDKLITAGKTEIREGDIITINGSTGDVILGAVPTIQPEVSDDFETIMVWADEVRTLNVRTNAETPADCWVARKFGAEGIGLCRTEHMFFDSERITAMREMIVATDVEGRRKAIGKLLPYQKKDFKEIFEIMEGLPVTIRLLDPPLHEFLPHIEEEFEAVAKASGITLDKIKKRSRELYETNPMLGHRGCRLALTYPELYEMQTKAIFEAAVEVQNMGMKVIPEIMIPLVFDKKELSILRTLVDEVAEKVFAAQNTRVEYLVGTMIELPRAALQAGNIAESADFFSFGTNDLTQTTLGISRDDAGSFIPTYIENSIFEKDPFAVLDVDGVGELIKIAVERGRKTRKDLKLGICGEHGGNPPSIEFCHNAGLDYVSCSPFRVPIARLASAQAKIKSKQNEIIV